MTISRNRKKVFDTDRDLKNSISFIVQMNTELVAENIDEGELDTDQYVHNSVSFAYFWCKLS